MPRHPIGKPVKVVPSGDVPAALKWVGYAKKRAWELLAQGTWRRKVIHPDADTTIRIETLAGIPRVTIEVRGGEEYILLTANTPEYPYSLVGGPYKAGAATQKYPNVYGANATTSRHIQRMADGWYLFSGRSPLGTFGNGFGFIAPNMQLATISSPWTYFDSGAGQTLMGDSTFRNAFVSDSCYAGLDEDGINIAHHLYMRLDNTLPSPVVGPAVLTAVYDGTVPNGFSWSVKKLDPVFAGFEGEPVKAYSITYMGEQRLAILGWVQTFVGGPQLYNFLHVRFLSSDNGATWSVYADASPDIRFLRTACYVGNGVTLGFSNYMVSYEQFVGAFFDVAYALNTWVSEDYGVSFNLRVRDTQKVGPNAWRPICIGLGACAYISWIMGATINTPPLMFYRTTDYGFTWEASYLGNIVSNIVPASLAVIDAGTPSDLQANTTKLMFVGLPIATEARPNPGWSIIYSLDGGQTWSVGNKITADSGLFSNTTKPEMYVSERPPFPVFPDLHKNGFPDP